MEECDRKSIQAYEHFSTQVYIPLISQSTLHSSIIVNAFEHMNDKLHSHLNLQAYRHIIIQVCAYVYGYQTYEYQCMRVWEHVIIKVYVYGSISSPNLVRMGVCNHQIMSAFEHSNL